MCQKAKHRQKAKAVRELTKAHEHTRATWPTRCRAAGCAACFCLTASTPHHAPLAHAVCTCAPQGNESETGGASSSGANEVALWVLKIFINIATGITQVNLPFFNRNNPMQGANPARESMWSPKPRPKLS